MSSKTDSMDICKLPREPFLGHSDDLCGHLLSFMRDVPKQVLELGCGPRSPLYPMLKRRWPAASVHQIDAQPEVVRQATAHNLDGCVEQMLASNMVTIPAGSKDLVMAMSVFDQNPAQTMESISQHIHRVLAPSGHILYLHNEELNLPATANSFLTHAAGAKILLPNDRWRPGNDFEYGYASREAVEVAISSRATPLAALDWFLRGSIPQFLGNQDSASPDGKVEVPFLKNCTPEVMHEVRKSISFLRDYHHVSIVDVRTSELLRELVERELLGNRERFEILDAGVFELRRCIPWRLVFDFMPPKFNFVRGLERFGFAWDFLPEPLTWARQELNACPVRHEDEVMLIAYQYGVIARRVS